MGIVIFREFSDFQNFLKVVGVRVMRSYPFTEMLVKIHIAAV